MIRNGNICFVPTSLAAPEICDREFISGLSVSSVSLTMGGGNYVQAYIGCQTHCGRFLVKHFSHKVENLEKDNSHTLVDFHFCSGKLRNIPQKRNLEWVGSNLTLSLLKLVTVHYLLITVSLCQPSVRWRESLPGILGAFGRQQVGYQETSSGQGTMTPGPPPCCSSWAGEGQRGQREIDGPNSPMSDHLPVQHWHWIHFAPTHH